MNTKFFVNLLRNKNLKAYQIERICNEEGIRLSVFGWSEYAVENGRMKLYYKYRHEEFTVDIRSAEELNFFDNENISDFEYQQSITAEMIKALRSQSTENEKLN